MNGQPQHDHPSAPTPPAPQSSVRYDPAPEPAKPAPADPPAATGTVAALFGFVVGLLPWMRVFSPPSHEVLLWMIVVSLAMPCVGLLLAIFATTRRFGLGVLLAAGVGWLLLLVTCGSGRL